MSREGFDIGSDCASLREASNCDHLLVHSTGSEEVFSELYGK
jgi:hypothetical protein